MLLALIILEGFARTYDFFLPICSVLSAEPYDDYNLKNQICTDLKKLKSESTPLFDYRIPISNQHYDTIQINNYGFRGEDIDKLKSENTTRIFVVGGSTVAGFRSSETGTFPFYLEELLKNNSISDKIEIINAGVSGIESTQELLLIKNYIIQFEPDVIIVYDGANDLYHSLNYKPGISNSIDNSFVQQFKNLHAEYFSFYETVNMFYDLSTNPSNPLAKEKFDDSNMFEKISRWGKNITEICTFGQENNFKTIYALQPILGTGDKKLTNQETEFYRFYDHENMIPHYSEFANNLEDIESHCDITIDLRNIFDEHEEGIYMDGVHVGYTGNKIIAEKIYEKILHVVIKDIKK